MKMYIRLWGLLGSLQLEIPCIRSCTQGKLHVAFPFLVWEHTTAAVASLFFCWKVAIGNFKERKSASAFYQALSVHML